MDACPAGVLFFYDMPMSRLFLIALMLALSGPASAVFVADAVVGRSTVSPHDSGHVKAPPVFGSIAAALAAAPDNGGRPYRVLIRAGLYREKLAVHHPGVHLVGEDRDTTIIAWSDSASDLGPDGLQLGTAGSATLTVLAPDFRMQNLTVRNDFDYAANAARPTGDPSRVERPQAVAVLTTGRSDRAVFENVTIKGFQDTLFVDAGRHYFKDCRILGHVDFIFGAGQAVFDQCEIVSRNRLNKNPTGYITAPSTNIAQPYGLLFVNSRFLKETPRVPAGSVRLGRPWHPGADPGAEGSAVFIDCYMEDHIGPEGYAPISAVGADGVRVWFEVGERSRFFEYGSHGPGGAPSARRPRLKDSQAQWYSEAQVLNGWSPFIMNAQNNATGGN